ncbi:MAG: UDP-N-acetylmuramoyl-tripeptide--D-alanyl-D-alanine ligase [Victivallales bacterium]|nr:UDP-N-acetylmuramoyl-tripeptide--D-alanyl-D-alanine ligase [Victivallales bacterium]
MGKPVFNAWELSRSTGGCWYRQPAAGFSVAGILTDSRKDCSGSLFLALRGEVFDAHDFLPAALTANAAALCIEKSARDRIGRDWDIPVLLVDDTMKAYQAIANFHRKRFPGLRAVAITGSMGKTSCKEILRSILIAAAGEGAVYATAENTNNQIGVPQNLLNICRNHRFCVLEMGTNHFGEIEPLSRTLEPDVAVINSIGPCHLEAFGDLRGVAREKADIFCGLKANGIAVIPVACPEAEYLLQRAGKFKILRPGIEVKVRYSGGNLHGSGMELDFPAASRSLKVDWALAGVHQAANAAVAATAALGLGIAPEHIAVGLSNCVLPGMRMKTASINGIDWINDAYNANPGSMEAALRWLGEFAVAGKLVLALGDMLELGESSCRRHGEVMRLAFELFPEAAYIFTGEEFSRAGRLMEQELPSQCFFCVDSLAARKIIEPLLEPGKTVFLKGSRGMKLENLWPDENAQ